MTEAKIIPASLYAAGLHAPLQDVYGSIDFYYAEGVLPVVWAEILMRETLNTRR